MIVESNKSECPIIAVDEKKTKCPFAAADKTDRIQKKNNKEKKNSSSASFVMPPHPPGWRSLPIVGHAPMLLKYAEEGGELAPALLKAFNMCDGDMASLDIPGMGQNGFYVTSNADYAGIVSTDLEHWGKITHKDTRGPFYMARQVIGDALFVASDTEPNWGKAHRILMPGKLIVVVFRFEISLTTLDRTKYYTTLFLSFILNITHAITDARYYVSSNFWFRT